MGTDCVSYSRQTLKLMKPHLKVDLSPGCKVKRMNKTIFKRAGAVQLRLNGCVGCNEHVYLPKDKASACPRCGHPRYKPDDGRPFEECFYFPLRPQFQRLLKLAHFRHLLMYEERREVNTDYIADVYDSPRWNSVMGETTTRLTRICLQGCVDGVPPFQHGNHESVKPIQYFIGNLAPWLRYKLDYMVLHMLILASLKGQAAKKYYDWAANYEMNALHTHGVNGVRVSVFGMTLDTPGRRELLQLQVRIIT